MWGQHFVLNGLCLISDCKNRGIKIYLNSINKDFVQKINFLDNY